MNPRIIGFDKLILTPPTFPNNYQGFSWAGQFGLGTFSWPIGGYKTVFLTAANPNPTSQNDPPRVIIARAGQPWDLIGMFLALDPGAPMTNITIEGWNTNQPNYPNYTRIIQLDKVWRAVEFLFMGIDTIKINTHSESVHINNISINEP